MTDEELVQAFEAATLDADAFTHAEHVRVAWWYLRHDTFAGALWRFSAALRRFATHHKAATKYHETITVAYLAVIADRLEQSPNLAWEEFARVHVDVIARSPSVLARYYSAALLQSDKARRTFLLPDLLSLAGLEYSAK